MGRFLVAAVITAILMIPAGGADAGGSWLLPDPPYLGVGNTAVARVVFGTGAQEGKVSDGPFHAYLLPEGIRLRPGKPVPGAAIPLGQIEITPSGTTLCCWVARIEFTVPDVPAGQYELGYCNDPCTVDGVGDLAAGHVWVAATAEQARLRAEIDALRGRLAYLRGHRSEARTLRSALEESVDRQRELRERIEALEARLARAPRPAEPAPLVPGWALVASVGIVLASMGGLVALRGRRVRVPDFVPPELEEADAQVPSRQPTTSSGSPGMVMASPGTSSSGSSPVTKS